ncbi:MAG: hypothetical protein ACOZNI_29600 [Myxococcota bacterium]
MERKWTRLEVGVRGERVTADGGVAPDLAPGLSAALADPLWLLARQWQLGELRGEDAASPVRVAVRARSLALSWADTGGGAAPLADPAAPLEPGVEAEAPAEDGAAWTERAEAGLQLFRMLDEAGGAAQRAPLRRAWPCPPPPDHPLATDADRRRRALLTRGSLDVVGFAADLTARGGEALPVVRGRPRALEAARRWAAWAVTRRVLPSGTSGWDRAAMAYAFIAGAQEGAVRWTLTAPGYPGGTLDWWSVDLAAATASTTVAPPAPRHTTHQPGELRWRGMPRRRFWDFEDAAVDFAGVVAEPEDPARMLLAEVALVSGDDWHLVPLRVDPGSLVKVEEVVVIDTFGGRTPLSAFAATDGAGRRWRLFELTGDPSTDAPWLYCAAAIASAEAGEPVEQVEILRDDAANLAWAVERRVEDPHGRPRTRADAATEPTEAPAAGTVRWTLAARVPATWVPLVPVLRAGRPRGLLRVGDVTAWADLPAGSHPGAIGRLVGEPDPPDVADAAVPRAGLTLTRCWQLARRPDGSLALWLGRARRAGATRAASGLRFDALDRG